MSLVSLVCHPYTFRQELENKNRNINCYPDTYITNSPLESVSNLLNDTERRVLNYFIWAQGKYGFIRISQKYLALKIGVCRETINRAVKKLRRLKLIDREYRQRKTSITFLSPIFKDYKFARALSVIFSSLWSFLYRLSIANVTLLIKGRRNNKTVVGIDGHGDYAYSAKPPISPTNIEIKNKNRVSEVYQEKILLNESFITPAIKAIKSLKLTQWGKIELSIYPDTAIDFADLETMGKKLNDPFKYFCSRAWHYCKTNKLDLLKAKRHHLASTYQMPTGCQFIENTGPIRDIGTEEKNSKTGTQYGKKDNYRMITEPTWVTLNGKKVLVKPVSQPNPRTEVDKKIGHIKQAFVEKHGKDHETLDKEKNIFGLELLYRFAVEENMLPSHEPIEAGRYDLMSYRLLGMDNALNPVVEKVMYGLLQDLHSARGTNIGS